MMSKKHPIEILEQALKYEQEQLESCQKSIKSMKNQATKYNTQAMETIARISGLEDALHKLKGLDNLEKKNKIADSVESTHSVFKEKFKAKEEELTKMKKRREDLESLLVENNADIQEIIVHLEILAEGIANERMKK